ncbi:MAG: thiamine phosphate synthase [Proteobacteria bacterium]|nr:thiamine phosphate synthase [Verrucomicrobiota bacterium]NBU07527.1 thiamine phosphate synthase [Pseudomonadota bacterium]
MKPFAAARLYTFVDTAYLHGRDPAEVARRLCDGGSDVVQLRAKGAPVEEIRRLAEAVLPVCERAGVAFVLNDHPKLALQLGAPCCHLGQEDFFDAGFRTAAQVTGCPPQMKLGLSTHAPEEAKRALRAAPDYIAIGPVFPTGTKPGRAAVTLDYVRWAAANVTLPWFAIGGINLSTLDSVVDAGARRICVVSAILNAPDIAAACGEFRQRLEQFEL